MSERIRVNPPSGAFLNTVGGVHVHPDGSVSYQPAPVDDTVNAAMATARLAQAAHENPTKLNLVLHAVSVWRQGCVHGGPGDCPECDALFLSVIAKHLGPPT